MLVVGGPVSDGFWVRATVVLVQAHWARLAGLRVAVAYRSDDDNYLDRRQTSRDGWTQYFEPIGGAEHAAPAPPPPPLLSLDCRAAADLFGRWGTYQWSYRHLARQRAWRAALVAGLPVRPRPRFAAAAAAAFHGNNSLGVPLRGPVLGVHMRGTDREPCGSQPAEFAPLVRAYLRAWPEAHVFVATDDAALLARLRARLGDGAAHRLAWLDTLRGESNHLDPDSDASTLNPGVRATKAAGWDGGRARAARLGREILVDTLVLSRCAFLLASLSAVPEYAAALSPGARLQRESFFVDVADYPAPEWGRAEAATIRANRMQRGNNVPNMARFDP